MSKDRAASVVKRDVEAISITPSMWRATALITSQSFCFGYVIVALNPCLVTGDEKKGSACFDGGDTSCPVGSIYRDLKLSSTDASLATSLLVIGAWIGCLAASRPGEVYGRKRSLLYNNLLFIVGAVLTASGNLALLNVGRFVSGLATGVCSVLVPVLLSEVASPETRGVITTLHQVVLTAAILIAALVGYGLVTYANHGWQYTVSLSGLPPLIMLLLREHVPESPKWLVNQGRIEEAVAVLQTIRPDGHNSVAEADTIIEDSRGDASNNTTWTEVLQHKQAMIVGCGLMFFQALTGINSVVYYSTTIFGFAGFSQAILATASFGVVNFVTTVFSASLVDSMGRKRLLLIGTTTMMCGLLVLSSVLCSSGAASAAQGYVAVFALLVYVFGFAIGLGAVVWVIMSELIPTRVRTKALSIFLCISWGSNLVVGLTTLPLIEAMGGVSSGMTDDAQSQAEKLGVAYLYFFFAGMSFISLVFIQFCVPETKGQSALLESSDVQNPLLSPRWP